MTLYDKDQDCQIIQVLLKHKLCCSVSQSYVV